MKINNRIAKFQRVSFEQFLKDYGKEIELDTHNAEAVKMVREVWDNIKLPVRKTKGSAGHDFAISYDITVPCGKTCKIVTGIKCEMEEDWVLTIYPRSSLGIKKNMFITNTIPVIDADYYGNVDNEGHILIFITNNGALDLQLKAGDAFAQGIFLPYGITVDDNANGVREGGIGSTTGK